MGHKKKPRDTKSPLEKLDPPDMKRLKKGPQVLRSSKTQRDTKNLAGHKKPSGTQKKQRKTKNPAPCQKPPRVGKKLEHPI